MKTVKEILYFCNVFTFNDHYDVERVVELNLVRDCLNNALSESDFISEDNRISVLGVLHDILLLAIDGNVENVELKKNNLRIGIL